MEKIHIHDQKQWMTWAGTPDEDRDHASHHTEVTFMPVVVVRSSDLGSAMIGLAVIGWMPVVIVFIHDRGVVTAP